MEELVAASNMRRALKRVRANKGSPGIDGMTVDELPSYLMDAWPRIKQSLLDGSYRPQPVKRVEIAKRGGGMRELGIPTVLDRLIQQALLQVLGPMCEPTFSDHSYGFRPGRNAYQAVESARRFVASVTDFLERKLRLRANRGKSAVGATVASEALGLSDHRAARDGADGRPGSTARRQGQDPSADAPEPGCESAAGAERATDFHRRLGDVFPSRLRRKGLRGSGPMDPASTAVLRLEAMEEASQACAGAAESGRRTLCGLGHGLRRSRPLASRRKPADAQSTVQPNAQRTRLPQPT